MSSCTKIIVLVYTTYSVVIHLLMLVQATQIVYYLAIIATPIDCAHYVYGMHYACFLPMRVRTTGLVRVGKGR